MTYVLILGAHADLGKSLAKCYAQNGYHLYLASRNTRELNRLSQDLTIRYSISSLVYPFDAQDFNSHPQFYKELNPKPNGVIVCFGYLGNQINAQLNFKETKTIIETNYLGAISILELVANDFSKRKKGWIIGISSVAGDRGRSSNYLYGSAKAGLSTYLSGLRNRMQKVNVPVMTVKPGFLKTKMTSHLKLPILLTTNVSTAANSIFEAQKKGRDILYVGPLWKWIMRIIIAIPESIFKRLSL